MLSFRKTILIFILFFILAAVFTCPLIIKINTHIPGFDSTDETFGALWNFWWLKFTQLNKISSLSCDFIAAPFGIDNCESGYPLWNSINKWLSILSNNVFTYNFEILFSFFASAIFMYYLALYINGNRACSIFCAIIYAFCPYHFTRAWQHLGLAQIQWMPLYILSLLKLKDRPTLKHILFTAISLYLVFAFDLYYAYFMLIVTAMFVIFLLGYKFRLKIRERDYLKNDLKIIKAIFISGVLVFLLITPTLYLTAKNRGQYKDMQPSANNPYLRPFEDLFSQSARPLSYLLPATVHPVFGRFTETFIGSSLYGDSFTEHTLYLGWVALLLAFLAFRRWRKKREDFYTGFFIFLAIAAWLFSQPPWWNVFGFKIYMPSFFMYKILPMFRAYCRFGIVVMLAIAVLAGFGLKFVLERFKGQKIKITVAALFCGLVLFEFWNWPPYKVIDVAHFPAVYEWLKGQPAGIIVAEYPLDTNGANEMYKFYQTRHAKKIINGTTPGTYANKIAKSITRLSEPDTAGILRWMGVRYVLVHKQNYLETELIDDKEDLEMISGMPGLKFIKNFPAQACPQKDIICVQKTGPVDVYEVVAQPIKAEIKEK